MFTTCPRCSLTLVVTTQDLRAAQGFVRCGRCSNVFNALANLSEDRSANADIANTQQQRALQQPPIDVAAAAESGTPEESPRYEEAPPPPPPPQQQRAPQPLQQRAAPQQNAPQPQQSAPRPAPPPQQQRPLPQQQNSFAPRGTKLPPPTAADLDDIPDISLEFDAQSTDISQVFVQQPARRLVLDNGSSGTFERPALKEVPQQADAEVDDEFDSQLRALAAQLSPTQQPTPQQAPTPPQRSAPVARQNPTPAARDTGATGNNPVLRMRPPASDAPVPRQQQPAPAPAAPQARQTQPPPQNREPSSPPPAQRPAPSRDTSSTGTNPVLRLRQQEEDEPVVRQSTGAPAADPPPMVRQTTGKPAPKAPPPPRAARKAAARTKVTQRAPGGPDRKGRSPEELIQAAAEVVKRAGRKRAVANGGEVAYDDEPEPDLNVVPDISESFPTRIRRRAFEAIESDGAALRARIPSLSWGTAAVALAALFVLQVINHYRNELATSDRLRKPLTSLYSAFGVSLVPRWDIGAYEVRQLGALAGGGNPSRLTVRLSVKNGAKSAQPLPYLRVTVQDRFGNRIASRDVPPEVYSPKRAKTLLGADARIDAEVAFVDPGQNATGFEIDACLPTDSGRIACANDQIAR
jgi:predicted Zn finger-like uncharacterized protein